MAYRFYTDKNTHETEAAAYIAYMIVGSYFHKAICRNPFLERRLYLYYREKGFGQVEKWEEKMIAQTEKELAPYEELLADMNCVVRMERIGSGYKLTFETGFERIVVKVYSRTNVQIRVKEGRNGDREVL